MDFSPTTKDQNAIFGLIPFTSEISPQMASMVVGTEACYIFLSYPDKRISNKPYIMVRSRERTCQWKLELPLNLKKMSKLGVFPARIARNVYDLLRITTEHWSSHQTIEDFQSRGFKPF